MAMQQLNGVIQWPGQIFDTTGFGAFSTAATLDAAGEYWAFVFQAREAMTISHIGFRCGVVAGSPTADVRIETVDAATGYPTGTLWAANTNIVTATLVSNTFALHALTASASISVGQFVAVKIAYNSGTSLIVSLLTNWMTQNNSLAYAVTSLGGTTVTVNLISSISAAIGSSATTFYGVRYLVPASAVTSDTTFNATAGEKKGVRFQIPFKCRCVGIRSLLGSNVTDINILIMDDSGGELSSSSTALDGHVRDILSGSGGMDAYFDSPVTLSPGTWYRVAMEPTEGATNSQFHYITLPNADYRRACPGGVNFYLAELASSTWTDSTDKIPYIDLLIDQLDDGVSSGGAHFSAAYG